jgi:uncharacterized protein (DUF1501 family)
MLLGGGAGLCFASMLRSEARAASGADALIVLWLNGGPSHVDTFDPKKSSAFRAIATRAPNMQLSQHLPQLAGEAHRIALIRSLTSNEGNHERARKLAHTGHSPNPTVAHPSLGAWVSQAHATKHALPSFISIGGPSSGPGFLGVEHAPFVVSRPGEPPDNLEHGLGVDAPRFERRMHALSFVESRFAARGGTLTRARGEVVKNAVELMGAPERAAFDVSNEPEATIKAYGDSPFGRGCLAARRLVEAGTRVIEVTLDGWDTHENNNERTQALSKALDPALTALLRELAERGRLARTIVLCMGEFGRSPEINEREGRNHHPRAFSALLAGGGAAGGMVYGATDDRGEAVVDRPMRVADLLATVAARLGLDPAHVVDTPAGRPVAMTDGGRIVPELFPEL